MEKCRSEASRLAAAQAAAREACRAAGEPFHVDALAAALGVSFEELMAAATDERHPVRAARLRAAMQECTASVVGEALRADPKSHGLWMFYLRSRGGLSEERAESLGSAAGGVTFVGEERI